jgi:flagellar FliL protein
VFKNKLLQLGIIIIIAITLIAGACFALYYGFLKDTLFAPETKEEQVKQKVEKVDTSKYTADELLEMTVKMEDLTANLADGEIVMLSLTFLLDSVEAKEEFEKLDFIPREIVLKALADMKPEDLVGSKGSDKLSATLMNKINPELTTGKLSKIYVTKLMQP